eukprot:gene17378-biopygen1702
MSGVLTNNVLTKRAGDAPITDHGLCIFCPAYVCHARQPRQYVPGGARPARWQSSHSSSTADHLAVLWRVNGPAKLSVHWSYSRAMQCLHEKCGTRRCAM